MAQIKLKRGPSANLTSTTLLEGEPAFTTDTKKLYVGDSTGGKVLINPDVKALTASDIPTLTMSKISDAGTAAKANTGTASGNVPVLDANGKLPDSVYGAIAITDTFVVNTQAAMLALTAEVGDVAVRTDLNKSYILKTAGANTLANWQELLTPASPVQSVNGMTGAVTITDITGNAGTAAKLGTATVGSATLPVYLNGGTPTALTQANLRIGTIGTAAIGSATQPVYFAANGVPTATSSLAPLASPALTGTPTAPTAAAGTNTTQIATTAFVMSQGFVGSSSVIDGGTF